MYSCTYGKYTLMLPSTILQYVATNIHPFHSQKKKKKKNHLFNQIIVYIWRTIIINTSEKRCTSFTIMKTYNLQLSYLKFLYHTYCVMSCFYPFVMFLSICNTKSCVMSCFYPSVILYKYKCL